MSEEGSQVEGRVGARALGQSKTQNQFVKSRKNCTKTTEWIAEHGRDSESTGR